MLKDTMSCKSKCNIKHANKIALPRPLSHRNFWIVFTRAGIPLSTTQDTVLGRVYTGMYWWGRATDIGFRNSELSDLAIIKHSCTSYKIAITASMAEDQQILGIDLGATTW